MEPDLEDYKQLTTDDEDVSDEDSIALGLPGRGEGRRRAQVR